MASAFEKLSSSKKGITDVSVGNSKSRLKIESLLEFEDFSDGEYKTGRIYPGLFAIATHWVDFKKQDGDIIQLGYTCKRFDPETAEFDSTKKCAFCSNRDKFTYKGEESNLRIQFFFNFLNRDRQENLPKNLKITDSEEKSGFKDKNSSSVTPIRVVRCPTSLIERFKKLQRVGKKETKLDDPEKGRDVSIMFNKDEKSPANMWDAQKADDPGEPLSKKEKAYLLWDIKTALEKLQSATTLEDDEKEVDKIMAQTGGKKSKDKSKKKAGKASEDEDEDEEVEEKGKKSKDKSKKKTAKSDDDEDEDEKPKKGKKSKSDEDEDEKPKKGKKKSKSDDEDDEDEKPKKGKKSKSDDEDDEDEKPKKGKKKSKSDEDDEDEKPKKGKKSKFDIDDDEDDEPKKGKKKSKSDDDEDEDEKPKKGKKKK